MKMKIYNTSPEKIEITNNDKKLTLEINKDTSSITRFWLIGEMITLITENKIKQCYAGEAAVKLIREAEYYD